VQDRKGDVLVAQNKLAEARTAYQAALDKMDKKHPGRQLVQIKLEAIGGTGRKRPSRCVNPRPRAGGNPCHEERILCSANLGSRFRGNDWNEIHKNKARRTCVLPGSSLVSVSSP
jgi:hypothetical protein